MASFYAQIDVNLMADIKGGKPTLTKKPPKTTNVKIYKKEPLHININKTKLVSAVMASASFANSAIGSYTGNKNTQSNTSTMLGITGVALVAMKNPALAVGAVASYSIKRATDMYIEQKNSEQESRYNQSYIGKMTTSGSRWKGGNL